MRSQPIHDISAEERIATIRRQHLIGTFKVMLPQTQNHPDQRALDQSWVDQLVQLIGSPESLNRALHPVGVVLLKDEWAENLVQLANSHPVVPALPKEVVVQVFSGQHRLAMLSQLGLEGPDQLWWHAEVYKKELETNHPADFLTMMHESNTPQVMKVASDLELFRAVFKLKGFLTSGKIDAQTYVQNRRMLLRGEERTNRAIANLARNDELAGAISKALSYEHIAREFSAGSWMRLTTGRLYMVAAGLVDEMVAQVGQLTAGMVEIPQEALSLQPRHCTIAHIEAWNTGGKKKAHPWDLLPGKRAGALKRAIVRPSTFVSHLNPKTADSWSLPHLILLPCCLGSKFVEDELKTMQTVTMHLVKMISTEVQFHRLHKGQYETIENPNDHPAGIIASFIAEKHAHEQNAVGFERKIMHILWKSRAELHQQLGEKDIPDVNSSGEADYQRLLAESKPWWDVMRQFKMRKLHSRFSLFIPKEFGAPKEDSSMQNGHVKHRMEIADPDTRHKRARVSVGGVELQDEVMLVSKQQEQGSPLLQVDQSSTSTMSTPTGPQEVIPQTQPIPPVQKRKNRRQIQDQIEGLYESDESKENDNGPIEERRGGDRRLVKALDRLTSAVDCMTRGESRVVTKLLEQIMDSRGSGQMEVLVSALVEQGKETLLKLEKQHQVVEGGSASKGGQVYRHESNICKPTDDDKDEDEDEDDMSFESS